MLHVITQFLVYIYNYNCHMEEKKSRIALDESFTHGYVSAFQEFWLVLWIVFFSEDSHNALRKCMFQENPIVIP